MVVAGHRPGTQPPRLLLPLQAQRLGRPHVCGHTRSPAATTAATWDPARAHGADCPHPHPRRGMEADTPRQARESKFTHRERGSPRTPSLLAPPGMRPRVGEVWEGASPPRSRVAGERNPVAVATVSKRTGAAPHSGSLVHWRPPSPSLPFPLLPSLWCGLGEDLAGVGVGVRGGDPGPERGAAAGRGSARDHLPSALWARTACRRRRSTHGPGHPPRARPPGSGQAARAPRTEPPAWGTRRRPPRAGCSSERGSERWAGAAERAHGRVHGTSQARRARARRPPEGSHPPHHSRPRRLSREPKADDPAPTCRARDSRAARQAHPAQETPHSSGQQGVRNGHTQADLVHIVSGAHRSSLENPDTHTQLSPGSTHDQAPNTS